MFYPVAVLIVAVAIMAVLVIIVIPSSRKSLRAWAKAGRCRASLQLVLNISDLVRNNMIMTVIVVAVFVVSF